MTTSNPTGAWLQTMHKILTQGKTVTPRGKETLELSNHVFTCSMADPVIRLPQRKLSFTFMAAEALWILNGDSTVAGIAPYNKNIAQFSDDGQTFYGAYGPRVVSQLEYVVCCLISDRDTRQATLTIWRPNPPKTKDYPCTVAMDFKIRDGYLNCHVFMRSSDAWLGLPYDLFNFSMIAAWVACQCSAYGIALNGLGDLYVTAASSHLYQTNFEQARACVDAIDEVKLPDNHGLLQELVVQGDWAAIKASIVTCRDNTNSGPLAPWAIRPASKGDTK